MARKAGGSLPYGTDLHEAERRDDAALRGVDREPAGRALDGAEGEQADVGNAAVLFHGLGDGGRSGASYSSSDGTSGASEKQKTLIVVWGVHIPSTATAEGPRRMRRPPRAAASCGRTPSPSVANRASIS